jgi:hypothetical protein
VFDPATLSLDVRPGATTDLSPGSYGRSLPASPGTRFAVVDLRSTGFAKEDDVSWKKPFGWKSARFNKIVRRLRVKEFTHLMRTHRPAAIAIAVIGVLATAMLFAASQSSPRGDTRQATAPKAAHQATATAASAPAAESRSHAAAAKVTPVTITGCLERSDETFRLKDTAGTDAPRSRSWKTAFLKKGSASIEVVDARNRLKMNNYVGQRVSLTGTLVDREMHARLLQRIAPSCAKSKSAKSDAL